MKKTLLILLLLFPNLVSSHDYSSSFKVNDKCYEINKKEDYIKGNNIKYGYLHKWTEYKQINCRKHIEGNKNHIIKINQISNLSLDKFKDIKLWINQKFFNKLFIFQEKNIENFQNK